MSRKKSPKRNCPSVSPHSERRSRVIQVALTPSEVSFIEHYMSRYRITNRSTLIRSIVMKEVIRRLNHDYPTIFPEEDL